MSDKLRCLPMSKLLSIPIPEVMLPKGYSIININEDNGYLRESVMEDAYNEEFLPGTFRVVMVSHPYYAENQVFVMIDEAYIPVATASSWNTFDSWDDITYGSVIHVGVIKSQRGKNLGEAMVYHVMKDLKKRGFEIAELGVDEGNLSAIKTYLNCGFLPEYEEEKDIELWQKQFEKLSLEFPQKPLRKRPVNNMPITPRPWDYQIRYMAEAIKNGELFVFGEWAWDNLFEVDKEHYIKLKNLIINSKYASEMINAIRNGLVERMCVDTPVNPKAVLLKKNNGQLYLIGKSGDSRFINGIKTYINRRYRPRHKKLGHITEFISEDLSIFE